MTAVTRPASVHRLEESYPVIAKDIFEEASKAIKPYIFQGQRMEFAFKQKAFDPVTEANEPFYKA